MVWIDALKSPDLPHVWVTHVPQVRYIAQVDTIDEDEFEGTFLKKLP